MIPIPAIDLFGGQAVRLQKGDYDRMTVYSDDPLRTAHEIAATGVTHLHLVDLEGAREGTAPHLPLITRICRESGLQVDVGGGIRSMDIIRRYLDAGVRAVVLGTAAVTDPELMAQAAQEAPGRIAVGLDVRGEYVAIRGWRELSPLTLSEMLARTEAAGIRAVTITDIARDGMLTGPSCALYRRVCEAHPGLEITASGGVSALSDLTALKETGVWGAIIGKAYYTGALSLRDAVEVCRP